MNACLAAGAPNHDYAKVATALQAATEALKLPILGLAT